jgi:hypothetical protein
LSQSTVDSFNEKYPVGTEVKVYRDNGDTLLTITRSAAEVCAAGYPVIWVKGIAGYYLLDRVVPIEEFNS